MRLIMKPIVNLGLIAFLLITSSAPAFAQARISGSGRKADKDASARQEKERKRELEREKLEARDAVVYPDGERAGQKGRRNSPFFLFGGKDRATRFAPAAPKVM